MLGPQELIIILLIVVMIFGAKRIPEIMNGLGKGIRSFKKAIDGEETPPAVPTSAPPSNQSAPPPTTHASSSEETTKDKPTS